MWDYQATAFHVSLITIFTGLLFCVIGIIGESAVQTIQIDATEEISEQVPNESVKLSSRLPKNITFLHLLTIESLGVVEEHIRGEDETKAHQKLAEISSDAV